MTREELDRLLSPDMKDDLIRDLRAQISKRAEEDQLRRIIREEMRPSDLGLSALRVCDFILPFVGLVAWLALPNLIQRRDSTNNEGMA